MNSLNLDDEIKNSHEYRTLTNFLSSSPQSLATALESFSKPSEDTFMNTQNASELESHLWRIWKSVVAVAATTTHDSPAQQKLTDFVLELRNRPTLKHQGNVCKVWDAVVWKDLPIFGPQMRETWNDAATDSSPSQARTNWINLNAFTATLVSTIHTRSIAFPPDNDFSLYAIWTIRMALEDNADSQQETDKTSLQAAAAWFVYAAPTLWALSRERKEFQGKIARQGQAVEGKEWRGFNEKRWEYWAERLKGCKGEGLVASANEAIEKARG